MNAAEKRHVSAVVALGCIMSRRLGYLDTPAEYHHIRTGVGAGRKSSHYDGIPLSPHFHRLSNEAIHVMGRKAWERHHGITELELLAQVRELMRVPA